MSRVGHLVVLLLAAPVAAWAQRLNEYGNPARVVPAPTAAGITAARPADPPLPVRRRLDAGASGRAGRQHEGHRLHRGRAEAARARAGRRQRDVLPGAALPPAEVHRPFAAHRRRQSARVERRLARRARRPRAAPGERRARSIFGGTVGDTTTQIGAAQAAGKVVVLLPAATSAAPAGGRGGLRRAGRRRGSPTRSPSRRSTSTPSRRRSGRPSTTRPSRRRTPAGADGRPPQGTAADRLVDAAQAAARRSCSRRRRSASRVSPRSGCSRGRPLDGLRAGTTGGTVTASLDFVELPTDWARNVVAIIPGSDPALRHEYVAIGAHNDHVGFAAPVDKDSVRAFNVARNRMLHREPDARAQAGAARDDPREHGQHPPRAPRRAPRLDQQRRRRRRLGLDGRPRDRRSDDGDAGEAEALDAVRLAHRRGGRARRLGVLHRRTRRCRWTRSSRRSTST